PVEKPPSEGSSVKRWKPQTSDMRLSPDGTVLAHARTDGLIGLWDVPSGRWIGWLDSDTTDQKVATIDFSPDGRTLGAYRGPNCELWDVRTRQRARMVSSENFFPCAVRFSPDGAAVVRGVNGHLQLFDTASGRILGENKVYGMCGDGMVFHPQGLLFASAYDS